MSFIEKPGAETEALRNLFTGPVIPEGAAAIL